MDISSKEGVASHKRLQEQARQSKLSDLRVVLDTASGRNIIWDILEKGMIFRTTYTGNSKSFFNEGKRSLALQIMNDVLEVMPTFFAMMIKEKE